MIPLVALHSTFIVSIILTRLECLYGSTYQCSRRFQLLTRCQQIYSAFWMKFGWWVCWQEDTDIHWHRHLDLSISWFRSTLHSCREATVMVTEALVVLLIYRDITVIFGLVASVETVTKLIKILRNSQKFLRAVFWFCSSSNHNQEEEFNIAGRTPVYLGEWRQFWLPNF